MAKRRKWTINGVDGRTTVGSWCRLHLGRGSKAYIMSNYADEGCCYLETYEAGNCMFNDGTLSDKEAITDPKTKLYPMLVEWLEAMEIIRAAMPTDDQEDFQ